jgi:hypothetical protein
MTSDELYNATFPATNPNNGSIWFSSNDGKAQIQQWGVFIKAMGSKIIDHIFYQVFVRTDIYVNYIAGNEQARRTYKEVRDKVHEQVMARVVEIYGGLDHAEIADIPQSERYDKVH